MKIIVLDRDGVINEDSDDYIRSAEEFVPVPNSIQAIARLSRAGYIVAVATNQSGLARGYFTEETLSEMHHLLCSMVESVDGCIDGIFYCPHHPNDGCACRKPGTGLLSQIEAEFSCDLKGSFFVGDSLKDIQAARAHGCLPLLVRTGKGARTEKDLSAEGATDVQIFDDLAHAVDSVLCETGHV